MKPSPSLSRRTVLMALAGGVAPVLSWRAASEQAGAPRPRQWPAVQKLINEWIDARRMAGCVAALSIGGEPFAYLAGGTIALDSATVFDEHSLCRIASLTKAITGLAVMMLVERGELRLDQPVVDIIPEWRVLHVAIDPTKSLDSRPTKGITIRHLLTHTSGLADWAPSAGSGLITVAYRERGITPGNRGVRLNRPGYGPQARDLVDMVNRVAALPLATEPGTTYEYSSVGYAALGLVIERVSGQSLDVFVRERIFDPLQMTSTGFQVQRNELARLTTNYDVTPTGLVVTDARGSTAWFEQPTLLDGGGGLISTARDFARFSTMVLNDGRLDGAQVLRPDTARLARSNLLPTGVKHDVGYGAGMRVALSEQGKRFRAVGTVSHGGATGTLWIADPSRGATLVFMTQTMPPTPRRESDLAAAIDADLA